LIPAEKKFHLFPGTFKGVLPAYSYLNVPHILCFLLRDEMGQKFLEKMSFLLSLSPVSINLSVYFSFLLAFCDGMPSGSE
jgi:hypothetical protein